MTLEESEKQLSTEELASFEKKYSFTLPEAYRELILAFNGGYPELPYFDEDEIYFTPIKYGDYTVEARLNVLDSKILPVGYYPFAHASESLYCIATKQNPSKIYRLDEDGEITEVSSSFEEFLDALHDED